MNIAGPGVMIGLALVGGITIVLDRLALKLIQPSKRIHSRNVRNLPFLARTHFFTSLGQQLKGWILTPETDNGGAVAVLAHGWGSSHGRMTLLAKPLLEEGHPVFLFDIRHHGDAPEARYVTARHFRDDILAATVEMKGQYPDRPLVLIGHSMGGSTGILSVTEGAPVDGLVTIAAPADLYAEWVADYASGMNGLTNLTDDPDGDEVINLYEYALRGIPTNSSGCARTAAGTCCSTVAQRSAANMLLNCS